MLDLDTLTSWFTEIISKVSGSVDVLKAKDYLLQLLFLKRLSDVFDDKDYKNQFYIPPHARWQEIVNHKGNIGVYLNEACESIANENEDLKGIINLRDFCETIEGHRLISDESLKDLVSTLSKYRIAYNDVEPDIIGRAYEFLLKYFSRGSLKKTGEFYTPKELARLISLIVDPQEGESVYDPCLGSGGLLINVFLRFKEKYSNIPDIKPLEFYGQEIVHSGYVIAKMNFFTLEAKVNFAVGDTMNRPAFTNKDGSLMKFDIVVANPMWNQNIFKQSTYETDTFNRFTFGFPPNSSADWGWVQHMFASLKDKGRMAVVLDTGAVSRGSGNQGSNRERDIRKAFVENDFIEAVILLPENLFYNTTSAGIILVINKNKKHKDKILLINASKIFEKGRPKNFLPDKAIKRITKIYRSFKEEDGISKVVTQEEVVRNDYNLSPSRYVSSNGDDTTLPLEEAVVLLKEAKEEQEKAEEKLKEVLKQLGFEI